MRRLYLVVGVSVAALAAGSCHDGAGEARLRAANVRTFRLAAGDSAAVTRARVELEGVLVRDGAVRCGTAGQAWGRSGSPAAYADSARARMCARLGFVRWRMRDTTGSLRAYRAALPYAHLQRDDSARAEALRSAAYVAAVAGDTALAVLVLDGAERVARAHGLNPLVQHVLRCKTALFGTAEAIPCEEPTDPHPLGAVLVFLAIVVAGLVSWHVRGWAQRG